MTQPRAYPDEVVRALLHEGASAASAEYLLRWLSQAVDPDAPAPVPVSVVGEGADELSHWLVLRLLRDGHDALVLPWGWLIDQDWPEVLPRIGVVRPGLDEPDERRIAALQKRGTALVIASDLVAQFVPGGRIVELDLPAQRVADLRQLADLGWPIDPTTPPR